jgi:hypothetical protein
MFRDLLDQAEVLCRVIAGDDLKDQAVYLLPSSAVPEEMRPGPSCAAYTQEGLATLLRQEIGPRWRGEGFAAVLSERSIGRRDPAARGHYVIALAVHELAHWVSDQAPKARRRSLAQTTAVGSRRAWVAQVVSAPDFGRPPAIAPWSQHAPLTFVRAALHLAWRACRVGQRVRADDAVHFGAYGLSESSRYLAALAGEPAAAAARPFADIMTSVPPIPFIDLAAEDFRRFRGVKAGLPMLRRGGEDDSPASEWAERFVDRHLAARVAAGERKPAGGEGGASERSEQWRFRSPLGGLLCACHAGV